MRKIVTEFKTHEEADQWANSQGMTVIMVAKSVDGVITLHVV